MATIAATAHLVQALANLMITVEQLPSLLPPKVTPAENEGDEPRIEPREADPALRSATKAALLRVLEGIGE